MAVGPSVYLANKWLDALCNNVSFTVAQVYVQLHIGDPGAAGTTNPATDTTRKAVSFGSPSGGAIANDAVVSWSPIAGSQDATHVSMWDAAAAGNFLGSAVVTANAYVAGDTFNIPVGDFDIVIPVAS